MISRSRLWRQFVCVTTRSRFTPGRRAGRFVGICRRLNLRRTADGGKRRHLWSRLGVAAEKLGGIKALEQAGLIVSRRGRALGRDRGLGRGWSGWGFGGMRLGGNILRRFKGGLRRYFDDLDLAGGRRGHNR